MSYFEKTEYKIETKIDSRVKSKMEYEIVPGECFSVIRNCSGCGQKSHFINTRKFRVNANGGKADIWLIYQCENCRHTLNLTIYERLKVSSIPEKEYKCFLGNDEELAEKYGKDIQFFRKNRAEVDFERLPYEIVLLHNTKGNVGNTGESIDNSAENINTENSSSNAAENIDFAVNSIGNAAEDTDDSVNFNANAAESTDDAVNFSANAAESNENSISNTTESIGNTEEPSNNTKEEADCITWANFTIKNPWKLKIRPEKQIAEAFKLSRSQVKKLTLQGRIKVEYISSEMICGIIQFSKQGVSF